MTSLDHADPRDRERWLAREDRPKTADLERFGYLTAPLRTESQRRLMGLIYARGFTTAEAAAALGIEPEDADDMHAAALRTLRGAP